MFPFVQRRKVKGMISMKVNIHLLVIKVCCSRIINIFVDTMMRMKRCVVVDYFQCSGKLLTHLLSVRGG